MTTTDQDPRQHPAFLEAIRLLEEERREKCSGITMGSIYGRKGGNRWELCEYPARYRMTDQEDRTHDYCGVHIRKFRIFNESYIRTGRLLGEARGDFYKIAKITPDGPTEAA